MQSSKQKIKTFAQCARKFCKWADKPPSNSAGEARLALKLLADLLAKVLQLPEIKSVKDVEAVDMFASETKRVYKRFGSLPFNYYSQVFDPLKTPSEEPVVADLADDLSDIYGDLRKGLALYDRGHEREAAWEWQLHFRIHWGRHLLAALYALYCYNERADADW